MNEGTRDPSSGDRGYETVEAVKWVDKPEGKATDFYYVLD
jgi:hypothetical protein